MITQDVINLIKYGEVTNLAIKNDTAALLSFINMGVMELYKRFPLNVEEHIVDLEDNTVNYDLPLDFMYPLEAYGEVPENSQNPSAPRISINDSDDPYSIFFPNYSQVQIPLVSSGDYVSIIYVTKPIPLTEADLNTDIGIPDTLIEALIYYVGFRAHTGIRSDGQSENNMHWIRFDQSCKKARELGVAYPLDSWTMVDRLQNRGFV